LIIFWEKKLDLFENQPIFWELFGKLHRTVLNVDGSFNDHGLKLVGTADLTPIDKSLHHDLPDWMSVDEKAEMIMIIGWCLSLPSMWRPSMIKLLSDKFLSKWFNEDSLAEEME
jgi:hypothetical protein